jgi:hypothetical protein
MTARTDPAMNHRSPQSNVLTPRTHWRIAPPAYGQEIVSSIVRQGSDGLASWGESLVDSGERVFISIEVAPAAIKVTRLVLAGLIPGKIVWEVSPTKVGGYNAYVSCFNRMFSIKKINRRGPLEAVKEARRSSGRARL